MKEKLVSLVFLEIQYLWLKRKGEKTPQYFSLTPYQREHNCINWKGQEPEKGNDDSKNRK